MTESYTTLNECVDYATSVGELITKGKFVRITYGLVTDMGQYQEDCRTWHSKSEQEKIWTLFQVHFIEAQANLQERQKTF